MSGDFFIDSPVPPKLDLTGARSRFYHSPQPESATSSLSLCRTLSTPLMSSCKRARYGYGGLDDRAIWDRQSPVSRISSPVPLANTEYLLAEGGLDTGLLTAAGQPILGFSSQRDGDNEESELDYRPTRYRKTSRTMGDVPVTPSNIEGTKRKRDSPVPQGDDTGVKSSPGWGEAVLNLVGGVAGKVWNFCVSAPFRGFHAGGGMGYDMDGSTATVPPSKKRERPSLSQRRRSSRLMDDIPVPGRYPVDEHYHVDKPRREDIHNNWVLVKEDEDSRESSPSCSSKKHARRNSVARHVPARRSGARVQSKRPMTPLTPTRSTNLSPHIYSPSSASSVYKTPPKHTTVSNPNETPLSRETQRHAAKLRRKEREEDASIRRLNHQLKAMIREGRQALGTRIEVDEMDIDEWD